MTTLEQFSIQPLHEIPHGSSVREVIEGFKKLKTHAFLVVREGSDPGLVTQDDIIHKVMGRRSPDTTKVEDIMSAPVVSLDIRTSVGKACIFSCENGMKTLVVSREGTIAGVLPVRDLVPPELLQQSVNTEEFFNRVGYYGDDLVQSEEAPEKNGS